MKNILNLIIREHTESSLRVTYRLCESPASVYSITVDTDTPTSHESVSVEDVTRDRAVADRIFRLLADHLVTSCTVFDVLEDIL